MSIPFVDLKTQYQALKQPLLEKINKVLDHGQYILGPEVAECEADLSRYTGAPYSLTCASGTDALVMALMSIDIQAGDEVIVPAFSFIATAEAVVLVGAIPVFVDICPDTFNINVEEVSKALSPKTKAIIPVSLYGQPSLMDELHKLVEGTSIHIIEDAAQSFGGEYKGKKSCNLSEIGCTSFFPAKPLGCYGDGGAVFTSSEEIFKKLQLIRNHGQESRYYHTRIGINGRLDTIQCAVLSVKLETYAQEVQHRQSAAQKYTEALSQIDGVVCPYIHDDCKSVWAQYTLRIPGQRDIVQRKLQELDVPTAVHYPSLMSDQPAYKSLGRRLELNEARQAALEVLSLPMHGCITELDQEFVIDSLKRVMKL